MPKIINLKSSEDVTSAVEQLWETGSREVYFIVPKTSVLLKNAVALKLLKREADRLEKTVVLITKDEVGREMVKRAGLMARVTLPKNVEDSEEDGEIEEVPSSGEEEREVLKELPSRKFESMLEEEVKLKRELSVLGHSRGMSDIRPKISVEKIKFDEATSESIKESKKETEAEHQIKESYEKHEEYKDLDSYLTADTEEEEFAIPINKKEEAIADFVGKRPLKERKEIIKKDRQKSVSLFFSFKFLSFFIGGAVLVAAAVLYFVLPKAEIVLVPKSEAQEQELLVNASKMATKVDLVQLKIPAQLIKLDEKESKEFSTTGQRQLNDKAKGIITIFNEYSSANQSLVEKTRFVSTSGKVFRLTKSTVVPGAKIEEGKIIASSVDAEVAADQPGEGFNTGLTDFKIPGFAGSPKYDAFFARSKTAMTGGASGQAKVVSQEDFDKAKLELWQSLQPKIEQELKAQAPTNLKILDQATKEEIVSVESNVVVGNQAEKFTLTVKGSGTLLLFDEKDVLSLAASKMKIDLSSDKYLDDKTKQIAYSEINADFVKGIIIFRAKISENLVWKIDVDGIKRLIAGKKEAQIRQIFSERSEIDKARILFWPFWVKTVPKNTDKIEIKLSSE